MNLKEYIEELNAQLKEVKDTPWSFSKSLRDERAIKIETLEISLNIAKDWNPRIYDALEKEAELNKDEEPEFEPEAGPASAIYWNSPTDYNLNK